ncbi:DUF1552 domain-containing protein, partial [Prosthecobacter sp.]|uniref:DUF1552 domain-containing protein n=1 Tax=Prosthecobacter sp. TaxID=1965333 RepID=UPI001D95AADC
LNEGYYSHCSYRSPTQAMPAEINPRSVLNRLFGQTDQSGKAAKADPLDRQMLDLVIGGAKDLRRTLPHGDQQKLDEYLDSVRSVERRIAAIEYRQKEAALEKAGVASSKRNASDSPPIEVKIPEGDKRSEYMQVMCDLNVLAFQTDTTRVSTYIGSTPNGVSYPELGFTDMHHSPTHHNNEPEKVRKVAAITKFNIDQFAYMVKKMAALREGNGTLLDNCIMMWGTGLEDGNKHTRANLPFIIAGKGGGSINTGRFLADTKGNQGDLLSTLLACAGVPLDRPIGIATKQITEMMKV